MTLNRRGAASALVAIILFSANGADAETYVLVHGAFQDSKSWANVAAQLSRKGDKAVLVDLPGRGGQDAKTQTLDGYRDAVLAVVQAQSEPVILVGHSFGGVTISAVAEAAPERVKRLVFVAAYLPQNGQSLQSLSAEDRGTKFTKTNFVLAADYSTAEILDADKALIFANDAKGPVLAAIVAGLMPEPLAPMCMPVRLTPERFGSVLRSYIHTRRDNAVSYEFQKLMVQRTSVSSAFELDSGHAPQMTRPKALARLIRNSAKS